MWPNSNGVQRIIDATNDPLSIAVTEALFSDRRLLATRFSRHGVSEAAGASLLRRVSGLAPHPELRADLERHADDEARHARMFNAQARLTDLASARCAVRALPQSDHSGEEFGGDIAQFVASTHVAELRNLHLLNLYADRGLPMLTGRSATRTSAAIAKVTVDEHRHVTYTYRHVVEFIRTRALDESYIEDCAVQFVRLVWWEIASIARDAAELPAALDDQRQPVASLPGAFGAFLRQNGVQPSPGFHIFLETLARLLPEAALRALWSSIPPASAQRASREGGEIGPFSPLRAFMLAAALKQPFDPNLATNDLNMCPTVAIGESEARALAVRAARHFWLEIAEEAEQRCAS